MCLLFLSDHIQKFIDALKQKEFERLLFVLFTLLSVLPTLFYFEIVPDNGKGLLHMIMIYMTGRYIRMYRDVKLPRKAGILFVFLWIINGISHEIPIKIGQISHHLCKDNSITNLMMAVILFYLFKELHIRSRFINKAAANVFAVFALNDVLVTVVMERLIDSGFKSGGGVTGFMVLAGTVTAVLLLCLVIGAVREFILGRTDRWLGEKAEHVVTSIMP